MSVDRLIIEPEREDHTARHHVSAVEVEEVVFGDRSVRRERQGYYRLVGQTQAGRYLTIFLGPRGGAVYGLVTAQDATDAERRGYRAQRRR